MKEGITKILMDGSSQEDEIFESPLKGQAITQVDKVDGSKDEKIKIHQDGRFTPIGQNIIWPNKQTDSS